MNSKIIKFLSLVVFTSLILCGCTKKQEPKKIIRPVKYEIIKDANASEIKTFSGVVQADIDTVLSFKVDGNIQKLYVKEGDKVQKGTLLALLDKEPYVLKYEDALAAVQKASSSAINAQKAYSRMSKLYIDGAISDRQLDDAKANADATKNVLMSMKKKKDIAKLQLDYTNLYSPLDGFVSSLKREVNENVAAGTPVLGLISAQSPEVKINIPEDYINFFNKKDRVDIKIEPLNNKNFEGVIKEIAIDSLGNSTYPVSIKIANPVSEIRSGMSANVKFNINRQGTKSIVVPISCVKEDEKGRHVLLVEPLDEEFGKVKRVDVEVGSIKKAGLEIKSGLKSGDKIITAGVSKLKDGDVVKLKGAIL